MYLIICMNKSRKYFHHSSSSTESFIFFIFANKFWGQEISHIYFLSWLSQNNELVVEWTSLNIYFHPSSVNQSLQEVFSYYWGQKCLILQQLFLKIAKLFVMFYVFLCSKIVGFGKIYNQNFLTPTNEESYLITSLDKKLPAYHRNNYISLLIFTVFSEHENHGLKVL